MANIKLINRDCLEGMREMADNEYDLAIVDPPYKINAGEMTMGKGKNKRWKKKKWDNERPSKECWADLFRVSTNQIVWGGNYFVDMLPVSRGWIFWDKGLNGKSSFSDGELAYTSFDVVLRKANIRYDGFLGRDEDGRIHSTQKPIDLYRWLLQNYAKSGDKILDSHLGSGSIAIACDMEGFDLTGYEIDEEYYEAAKERFNQYKRQYKLNF